MASPKPPAAHLGTPDDIEQQFYEALQHGDIERLMAVWAEEDDIACVHPGGPRVVGAQAIRASFDSMFANGPVNAQPERVRRVHTQAAAVHSVVERVRVMTDEGPQSAWVVATNVYVKTSLGWRLVVHHASPGSSREAQDITETASVLH
jgi:uncharacterized protein (TIGR02246 family)